MAQQARGALPDRQAQAQALPLWLQAAEFLEHQRLQFRRDTRTAVPDFDVDVAGAAPAAEKDAAALGVAHRIGQEVLQDPPQHLRIAARPQSRRYHLE